MDVKLVMFKTDGQRKDFPVSKESTVIGRGEQCDLRVPIVSVSRKHCRLDASGGSLTVKDLGSSNGTYVNNERVTEEELHAGDRLVVGPVVFTVQIDGEPEEIKPVKTRGQKLAEASGPEGAAAEAAGQEEAQEGSPEESGEAIALEGIEQGGGEEDVDPISALEALAAETEEDEEDKQSGS